MADDITGEHHLCVQLDKLKYLEKEQNGTRGNMKKLAEEQSGLKISQVEMRGEMKEMGSELGRKIDGLGTKTVLTWIGAAIAAAIIALVKYNGN